MKLGDTYRSGAYNDDDDVMGEAEKENEVLTTTLSASSSIPI